MPHLHVQTLLSGSSGNSSLTWPAPLLIPIPILFRNIESSSEQVVYFSSPGIPSRLLYAARLVSEELKCEDDKRLGELDSRSQIYARVRRAQR